MRRVILTGVLSSFVPSALAQQWTVVVLHPAGSRWSQVHAMEGGKQVGIVAVEPTGNTVASLWSGSSQSWTMLGDPAFQSGAGSVSGPLVAGAAQSTAVLWNTATGQQQSLHPSGYPLALSAVQQIRGGMQVGIFGTSSSEPRAVVWNGTPESMVDLHPPGWTRSYAYATDGVLQGGRIQGSGFRAVIWSGSAASMINLDPLNRGSTVWGMAPGVQVGELNAPGFVRAALWRGTPESYVDLSPPGSAISTLRATTGRVHVGRSAQGFAARAAINFGTPTSWVGLHQFLPPQYSSFSEAKAVVQEGPRITVGGWAENAWGYDEAILWIGTDPCYANCDGSTAAPVLNVADFGCFLTKFASGDPYANCDESTNPPVLNVADFGCFLGKFAAGCP